LAVYPHRRPQQKSPFIGAFAVSTVIRRVRARDHERINAGLARAKANGTKLGRRRTEPAAEARILELKARGEGMLKIGRKLGIGTSVVQRVFKQVLLASQ
jgi:DNA invertase Pin-like site-specific DNA recombinase